MNRVARSALRRGLDPERSPAVAPPPGNPRFALMDSCRALALFGVFGTHLYQYRGAATGAPWGAIAIELARGLQLFFAISAFLLFRPYLAARASGAREPRLRDYAQRRALRILPGYWVALTVLAVVLGDPYVTGVFSRDWWAYYGLGQAYSRSLTGGIYPAWSLSVEVAFYAFLPLFAAGTRRLGQRLGWQRGALIPIAAVAVVGLAVRELNAATVLPWVLSNTLAGQSHFFAVGMALAVVSVAWERGERRGALLRGLVARPALAWAGALALFLLGAEAFGPYVPLNLPGHEFLGQQLRFMGNDLLTCGFVALILVPAVFGAARAGLVRRVLAWRPLAFAGMVSYGAYLYHWPLLYWLAGPGPYQSYTTQFRFTSAHLLGSARLTLAATVIPAALAAGTASYYLVELPFLSLKSGWRRNPRSPEDRVALPASLGSRDVAVSRSE